MSHANQDTTNSDLNMMETILVRVERAGNVACSIMYICHNKKAPIFSRTRLWQFSMIIEEFIKPPPAKMDGQDTGCHCSTRTCLPTLPAKILFPAWGENREKLEQQIRNHYATSAFNTCPHQPLQEMVGKPLDIVFKEKLSQFQYTDKSVFHTTRRSR